MCGVLHPDSQGSVGEDGGLCDFAEDIENSMTLRVGTVCRLEQGCFFCSSSTLSA